MYLGQNLTVVDVGFILEARATGKELVGPASRVGLLSASSCRSGDVREDSGQRRDLREKTDPFFPTNALKGYFSQ